MLRSTASKVMWGGSATVLLVGLVVILALVLVEDRTDRAAAQTATSAVLIGAGDIAHGSYTTDSATAELIKARPDAQVFTTGDNAYAKGTIEQFTKFYDPTWGHFRSRTWPTPGNHEYLTANAAGYKEYFNTLAQPEGATYYRKQIAGWSVYALDSGIDATPKGAQYKWLKDQLAAEPNGGCTLALWHVPVASSGEHGSRPKMNAIFSLLDVEGAELVLNGHDHNYERFGKLSIVGGSPVPIDNGVVQVVVGTGGTPMREFSTIRAGSLYRQNTIHGVLELTLEATGYAGKFIPVAGKTSTEEFSGTCEA